MLAALQGQTKNWFAIVSENWYRSAGPTLKFTLSPADVGTETSRNQVPLNLSGSVNDNAMVSRAKNDAKYEDSSETYTQWRHSVKVSANSG